MSEQLAAEEQRSQSLVQIARAIEPGAIAAANERRHDLPARRDCQPRRRCMPRRVGCRMTVACVKVCDAACGKHDERAAGVQPLPCRTKSRVAASGASRAAEWIDEETETGKILEMRKQMTGEH